MDDSYAEARRRQSSPGVIRPQTAQPSSNTQSREHWKVVESYMSNRQAEAPAGMMRPATAHPTNSNRGWQLVADLFRHKGYAGPRLPQLGVLNKGTTCLKDPNSLQATALRSSEDKMTPLPPLHTPLATTWIKGHLQVVTGQRNQLEDQMKALKHDCRATRMKHLEDEVGMLQAQLNHPPQAFLDMQSELAATERSRQQLQQDYLTLKQSIRATRIGELESDVEILKSEVMRLMKLLRYAQHMGTDLEALEHDITLQVQAKLQGQLEAYADKAKLAEQRAKAAERKLGEALERERALQEKVQELMARAPETVRVEPDPNLEERLRGEIEGRLRTEMEERLQGEVERLRAEMEARLGEAAGSVQRELTDEERRQLEAQLRAELEAQLREEIAVWMKPQVEVSLTVELRPVVEEQLRAELRAVLEVQLRIELEALLRAELEALLRAELRAVLEVQLRIELEALLRAELEALLRAELEPLLRQEIEGQLRAEFEERLLAVQALGSAGASELQVLLEERERQLAEAGRHAQLSLRAMVVFLRTRELPEDSELLELQGVLRLDVDVSAGKAAEAVPSLKLAHRVVVSQVSIVRDMLTRYKVLTELTDLEELFQEAAQHPATSGLPDVLRQLLALLATLAQDMRSLPGLPGNIAASMLLGDGAAASAPMPVAVMRSVCGVQDLMLLLQDQLDALRRQQPQGALVTLHADSMRQLALLCRTLVTDVSQVYGEESEDAAGTRATLSVTFAAASDMWARMSANDAARLLNSMGHRVAGWLQRNGLEELVVVLCGGAARAAWLEELQQLEAGREGGLERLLLEARPEPAAAMHVSRLVLLLQNEAAAAGGEEAVPGDKGDVQLADEEAVEAGGKEPGASGLPESGPLPLRETEGTWAVRLLREDIHVTMERYGLFRWSESLWQYGVKTVQHLVDASKDCSVEVQSLASAMCDLERTRLARLIRNGLRAAAINVPAAAPPTPTPTPPELTDAEQLGQLLLAAAQRGDALACEDLLANRGARPELAVDAATGRTALIAAAEGGYVDVVTLLLFYNADASVRDRAGRTALLVAARNMRTAACETLLLSGRLEVLSSVDMQDDSGTSAVVYACRNCMKDVAVKLVMIGANPEDAQPDADKNGFGQQMRRATLDGAFLRQELFLGAEDGNVARCERAIDGLPCGPNVKPRDDGFTPLHAAVLNGHKAVVKLLLKRGATPDARYARKTPLVCAAVLGSASMCRVLAAAGVDVKRGGYEALMEGCQHRQGPACLALLELGAPPAPDAGAGPAPRSFPLTVAAFNGMPDVVRALLEKGVQVDVEIRSSPSTLSTASGGFSALSYACSGSMYEAGTLAVAQLLLQRQADVNRAAADSATPLLFAAYAHGGDMVRLLLAAGARAGARGGRGGRSALMVAAARRGDRGLAAAEALLQAAAGAGAHEVASLCTAKDEDGRSAYDHALSSGSAGVAQLLEDYSVKTSAITGTVFRTYTGAVAGSDGTASGSVLQSQLRHAVSAGDVEGCRRALAAAGSAERPWGPDDAADGGGRTPLHLAVVSGAEGRLQVVQMLLDSRSDANRMYDYDSCALRDAALRGDVEMVRLLLPRSTAEAVRRLALQSAVYKRQEAVALELMAAAAGAAGGDGGRWGALLHEAAEQGLEQVCARLLAEGAGAGDLAPSPALRGVSNRGEPATALCVVAAALPPTAVRLCELLLQRGADVNAATEASGATALMFAASAARHHGPRAAKVVQLLLSRGARANLQGGVSRRTPLMWAAMVEGDRGQHVVQALLGATESWATEDLGQMLTAVDDAGDTAVMLAVGSRSEQVEQLIREAAAARGLDLPAAPIRA